MTHNEYCNIYYHKNKKRISERRRILYQINKDKIKERNAEWRKKNPDKKRESLRSYRRQNPDKRAIEMARYRAVKLKRSPIWANKIEIEKFYAEARRLTMETGVRHEVDHIVPLKGANVSGLHVENNLQVLTRRENAEKKNKFSDWDSFGGRGH